MNNYNILLADDHYLFKSGIEAILTNSQQFDQIHFASNSNETINQVQNNNLDILLLDINMPSIPFFDLIKTITSIKPNLPILMLTSSEDINNLKIALNFGAKGYLIKNIKPKEFINSILNVLNGQTVISEQMNLKLLNPKTNLLNELTSRELQLANHVISGLSNKIIADKLCISENTVKIHLKSIFKKLKIQNRVQLTNLLNNQNI